ncbi:hypothetical protein [Bryobacter aggregatus]|uniref:hypothetical protein n=1 Tax=Bryobacter aggregatus TaxID=360054 RepID=UPI0004E17977|nr:hypothetical protein [Bryobacter aggregatus]
MRRIPAVLLLFLFSFALIAPALFASEGESRLPACCRKHGKHGCSMSSSGSRGPSFSKLPNRCAAFPQKAELPADFQALAPTPRIDALTLYSHPARPPQVEAKYRVSLIRSAQKRGPPTLL